MKKAILFLIATLSSACGAQLTSTKWEALKNNISISKIDIDTYSKDYVSILLSSDRTKFIKIDQNEIINIFDIKPSGSLNTLKLGNLIKQINLKELIGKPFRFIYTPANKEMVYIKIINNVICIPIALNPGEIQLYLIDIEEAINNKPLSLKPLENFPIIKNLEHLEIIMDRSKKTVSFYNEPTRTSTLWDTSTGKVLSRLKIETGYVTGNLTKNTLIVQESRRLLISPFPYNKFETTGLSGTKVNAFQLLNNYLIFSLDNQKNKYFIDLEKLETISAQNIKGATKNSIELDNSENINLKLSNNVAYFYNLNNNIIKIWSTRNGRLLKTTDFSQSIPNNLNYSMTFSDDLSFAAISYVDKISFLDINKNIIIKDIVKSVGIPVLGEPNSPKILEPIISSDGNTVVLENTITGQYEFIFSISHEIKRIESESFPILNILEQDILNKIFSHAGINKNLKLASKSNKLLSKRISSYINSKNALDSDKWEYFKDHISINKIAFKLGYENYEQILISSDKKEFIKVGKDNIIRIFDINPTGTLDTLKLGKQLAEIDLKNLIGTQEFQIARNNLSTIVQIVNNVICIPIILNATNARQLYLIDIDEAINHIPSSFKEPLKELPKHIDRIIIDKTKTRILIQNLTDNSTIWNTTNGDKIATLSLQQSPYISKNTLIYMRGDDLVLYTYPYKSPEIISRDKLLIDPLILVKNYLIFEKQGSAHFINLDNLPSFSAEDIKEAIENSPKLNLTSENPKYLSFSPIHLSNNGQYFFELRYHSMYKTNTNYKILNIWSTNDGKLLKSVNLSNSLVEEPIMDIIPSDDLSLAVISTTNYILLIDILNNSLIKKFTQEELLDVEFRDYPTESGSSWRYSNYISTLSPMDISYNGNNIVFSERGFNNILSILSISKNFPNQS